jgi:hypothetical protein
VPDGTAVRAGEPGADEVLPDSLGARWRFVMGQNPALGFTGRCPEKCSPAASARK